MINNITFIFSFSAASNSAIFAIESTLTLDPNTYKTTKIRIILKFI